MNKYTKNKMSLFKFNFENVLILIGALLVILFIISILMGTIFQTLHKLTPIIGLILLYEALFSFLVIIFNFVYSTIRKSKLTEFKGTGTKRDPIIIDSLKDSQILFKIRNSKLYTIIRNINQNSIILDKCQNLVINSCKLNNLDLNKSSNITIQDSSISRALSLLICQNVIIDNCDIFKISIYLSHTNLIKNSKIEKIENEYSNANLFEGNKIPKEELDILYKKFLDRNKKDYFIILLIITFFTLIIFFISFLSFNNFIYAVLFAISFTLLCLAILGIVLWPMIYVTIRDSKEKIKIRKYPPNKVL